MFSADEPLLLQKPTLSKTKISSAKAVSASGVPVLLVFILPSGHAYTLRLGLGIAVSAADLSFSFKAGRRQKLRLQHGKNWNYAENGIMRKRIARAHHDQRGGDWDREWLDLEKIAIVEVTSEDPNFPIEYALGSKHGPGWRASQGGEQQIRIIFDEPVSLHRIELRFHEAEFERTQEFVLRWLSASGGPAAEIVRQQWNFSPAGSTTEIEHYVVDLDAVSVVELAIRPDLRRPEAVATLASWRLG